MSNIVLVHGGFVDGSGWEPVYRILRKAGHDVTIVQNPTTSLADDVAVTPARSTSNRSGGASSATPTAAPSSPRPATIRTSPRWCTSPRSRPTAGSR